MTWHFPPPSLSATPATACRSAWTQRDEHYVPFAVIVDADHRDVDHKGEACVDMLGLVAAANADLPHTVAHRLSPISPCNHMPWRAATAFECLANHVFTGWVTPEVVAELLVENAWCEPDGTPTLLTSGAGTNGAGSKTRSSSPWASEPLRRRRPRHPN